jgi:MFS family permease
MSSTITSSLTSSGALPSSILQQATASPEAIRQTYFLLLTIFPEAIIETMLNPLIPFLAQTLSPQKKPTDPPVDVGARSGLFFAAFYFPLLLMNVVWGVLSDGAVGRKKILLAGLVAGGLTVFVLGITDSFTIAVLCRFMAGVFGGNSTVAKGGIGEIHMTDSGRAWGYASYGQMFAISGIIGPILGGLLVSSKTALTESDAGGNLDNFGSRYPFFRPFFLGAVLTVLATITTHFCLREPKEFRALTSRKRKGKGASYAPLGENSNDTDEAGVGPSGVAFEDDESEKKVIGGFNFWSWKNQMLASLTGPMQPQALFPIVLYVC